jgi:hypothetical protein
MLLSNKQILKALFPNMGNSNPIKAITKEQHGSINNMQNQLIKMLPNLKVDPAVLPSLQMLLSNKQILKSLFSSMGHTVDNANPIKAITKEEQNPHDDIQNQFVTMSPQIKEQHGQNLEADDDDDDDDDDEDEDDDDIIQHQTSFSNPLYMKLKGKNIHNPNASNDIPGQHQTSFSNPLYMKLKEKNIHNSNASNDITGQHQTSFSNPLYFKKKENDVQSSNGTDDVVTQHQISFSNPLYMKLKGKNIHNPEATNDITGQHQTSFSNPLYMKLKEKNIQNEAGKKQISHCFSTIPFLLSIEYEKDNDTNV